MTVGDREMENFMRVASRTDDSVMFLDEETVVGKEGKRVEIMGGAFEGVTGVIRRFRGWPLRAQAISFCSGAEKRRKRDIHPLQTSPVYGEGANK